MIGSIAAVIVIEAIFFIEKKGIDDPVGAISVHGIGGVVRRASSSGCSPTAATASAWNLTESEYATDGKGVTGIFYDFGSSACRQLGSQLIGLALRSGS